MTKELEDMLIKLTEGEIDPLLFAVEFKKLRDLVKQINEDPGVNNIINSEVQKYGKETVKDGFRIELKEMGVKYDYTSCSEWVTKSSELKSIETYLKSIPKDGTADPETGQIIYPPARKSTTKSVITKINE